MLFLSEGVSARSLISRSGRLSAFIFVFQFFFSYKNCGLSQCTASVNKTSKASVFLTIELLHAESMLHVNCHTCNRYNTSVYITEGGEIYDGD